MRTGYATSILIGWNEEKPFDVPLSKRIKFLPVGKNKPQDAPIADCTFGGIGMIAECHVVIICVNVTDVQSISKRLAKYELANHKYNVTVFGMIRGVKFGDILRDELSSEKNIAMIECTVGFAVIPHPVSGALTPTTLQPSIGMERMNNEINKIAEGAVNLMDTIDMHMQFEKQLTPMGWGTIIYETLYVLNAVCGGTLASTMTNGTTRSILACMVRECRAALMLAAGGGKWAPDLMLVWPLVASAWALEMVLALPMPLFSLLKNITSLPAVNLPGPGLVDIDAGRTTMVRGSFEEILSTGDRHRCDMTVCACVLSRLKSIESSLEDGTAAAVNVTISSQRGKDQLQLLLSEIKEKDKLGVFSSSGRELRIWIMRAFTVLTLIALFWFIFVYEHE